MRLAGRVSLVSGVVVAGLALGPLAARASATLSGSGQAWGANMGSAQSAAEAQAHSALLSQASAHGYSTCVNISYSDTLVYVVPSGGGDVYDSTATGSCGTQTLQ